MRRSVLQTIARLALFAVSATLLAVWVPAAEPATVDPGPASFTPRLLGGQVLFGRRAYDADLKSWTVSLLRTHPSAAAEVVDEHPSGSEGKRFQIASDESSFAVLQRDGSACKLPGCSSEARVTFPNAAGAMTSLSACFPDRTWYLDAYDETNGFEQPLVAVASGLTIVPRDSSSVCSDASRLAVIDRIAGQEIASIPVDARRLLGTAASGKFVAVALAKRGLKVRLLLFDIETGKRLSDDELRVSPDGGDSTEPLGIDVNRRGSVVVSARVKRNPLGTREASRCELHRSMFLMPRGSKLRCLGIRPTSAQVEINGDTVVTYQQRKGNPPPGKPFTSSYLDGYLWDLTATNLRNGKTRIVRTTGNPEQEPFDFDGKRTTWLSIGCLGGTSLKSAPLTDRRSAPPSCPVEFLTKTMSIDSSLTSKLVVACKRGCFGWWDIAGPRKIFKRTNFADFESFSSPISVNPSPVPSEVEIQVAKSRVDAIKKLGLKWITLRWHSHGAPVDGRHHTKLITFKLATP